MTLRAVSTPATGKPVGSSKPTYNRNGEKFASGFVESAINQVVSKRMVKKQQMG